MSRTKDSTSLRGVNCSVEDAYINLAAEIYLRGLFENDTRFLNSKWGELIKDVVLEHAKCKNDSVEISPQNQWTNQPYTRHNR